MATGVDIASIASLVGDPTRAGMLAALMDGRALTATELAVEAGVTPATASGHLGKLTRAKLITLTRQGRHHYFRLASQKVARLLESIMVLASDEQASPLPRREPRIDPALRFARTCYDHLAGSLAVALADSLHTRRAIVLSDEAGTVTRSGQSFLADFGIAPASDLRTRRMYCRPCLDWSERRMHVAGALGAELLSVLEKRKWIVRAPSGRAVQVTRVGRKGLQERFGIELP